MHEACAESGNMAKQCEANLIKNLPGARIVRGTVYAADKDIPTRTPCIAGEIPTCGAGIKLALLLMRMAKGH